jgi:large subunit ribosomal protein L18
MSNSINKLKLARHTQRKLRVKGSVRGTTEQPRLAVFRSLKNIYAQIIDDETGRTLAAAGSKDKGFTLKHGGNVSAAAVIGKTIAERAKEKGVTKVAFDRGGFRYHGRIKALADAAREAGLKF